jgi:DNA-binding NtrC family response regulator
MIVWGFDGDILRKENFLGMPFLPLSKAAFGDDKVQDAFEFLRQLTARGLLALPRQNRHAVEGDFLAGEYGSMTSGPWLIRRAFLHYGRDWCDSIGVALPPFGRSNRRSTFLGGSCLSITGFTDGTLDSVALALIDYLTQPQPLLRYTQVTGHLPSSRASLGFDDPVHDSAGPSKQDTYAAYLTRLGARSSVLEVLKDALSVGRSYPSLPDWAEKVEARSTRIGLFNVWQNLAEGEPREVLGFGLESVAQSIDDDLRRVKTNNYYIYVLGALVGLALVSTGCYQSIRWRKRLVSRRSLKQEIDELVESSVKMHERMAELEEQSESSQGNLSQVSEKTRALAEEKEKVDLMLVERERELRSKGMKSKEDSLDDRESTAAGSLSMCRLAEKAWAEYETLTNAGSKANERYIEWGGVVLTEKSALARTKNKAETTAKWSDAVMITGERGTGKSILAKIIHDLSERSGEFKKTNCATIPESLIEDTLFGHVKGAFTGAIRSVQGLLGEASGGTLFLDEITQNRTLQAKILSAMEDKVYRKVGGNEDLYADVRIIVATNRDIFEALSDDALLKDFLDRMGAIQLHVPPLRERRQDIPALLFHFNKLHAVEKQVAPKELASDIVKACVCYSWPGNVRELGTSFFSRIYVLDKLRVELADLPEDEPGENLLQGLREAYDSTFRSSPTPAEMELYTEQFSESLSKLSAELQSQPPSKDMKQKAVAYLSTLKWPESYYQDLANELGPSCAQRVIVWLYESVWLPEYKRLKHGYQTPFREYAFRPLFGVNRKDVVDWHKTLRQS